MKSVEDMTIDELKELLDIKIRERESMDATKVLRVGTLKIDVYFVEWGASCELENWEDSRYDFDPTADLIDCVKSRIHKLPAGTKFYYTMRDHWYPEGDILFSEYDKWAKEYLEDIQEC